MPLCLSFALSLSVQWRDVVCKIRLKEFDIATICETGVSVVGDLCRIKIYREVLLDQTITKA